MDASRLCIARWGRFAAACVVCLCARPAWAQGASQAAAEALFQGGRALYDQGKYAEACPKLAESQRIEPAVGTLLALALCHEAEGKLASAWAEFTTVEGQARSAGSRDRETVANERAQALKPRLSSLAVDVPPEIAATPGLELRVDGTALGAASFGVAIPVDGGDHRVDVSAPGKKPWQTVVRVKNELDAVRVSIAPLEAQAASAPAASEAGAANATQSSGSTLSTVGLVVAGAGLVALGVGSYLALDAKSDYDAAKKQCGPAGCAEGPYQAGEDARGKGTIATVVFVVGGAAVAGGAALWLLAPGKSEDASSFRVDAIGVAANGVVVRGTF